MNPESNNNSLTSKNNVMTLPFWREQFAILWPKTCRIQASYDVNIEKITTILPKFEKIANDVKKIT